MKFVCPVCGHNGLDEVPFNKYGEPSFEICECCAFQFGFDDYTEDDIKRYRSKWLKDGACWINPSAKPERWNLDEQLSRIGVKR